MGDGSISLTPCVHLCLHCTDIRNQEAIWEQCASQRVQRAGFVQVPSWGSCFYHQELRLFLIVYVDEFTLAGPASNLAAGWTLPRQRINMEDPGPVSHSLGCADRTAKCRLPSGVEARVMVCDMEKS